MDAQIEASTEELEELEGKTASIEADIKALEAKILEIGGSRLLAQKSKVDGIRLHLNLASDEITKAEVAKTKAEKDLAKLEKSLRSNGESLEQVNADLEELEGRLDECKEYLSNLKTRVKQAQDAEENQKDDLDRMQKELDEKNEQVQAFRQREVGEINYQSRTSTILICYRRWSCSAVLTTKRKRLRRTKGSFSTGRMNTTSSS